MVPYVLLLLPMHFQLEELTDRVEETDIGVQTDPFLDRAPDPLFIPAKTGVDVETQIEDGDLFDFDRESKPILEVLVGKTIEQALMEVMEEEELDRLRDHQLQFEEFRNAELMETQRLEEQARRRREEKSRRLRQQAEVARQEREAAKKIAARSFAQSYLSGLVPSVFQNLESGGYFYDQQEREIEADFMPWLMDGVETRLAHYGRARALLDSIIADCVGVTLGDGNNEAAAAVESGAEGCADDGGEADAAEGDDVAGASGAGTADAGGGPVDETPVRKMTSFEALDKNSDGHISQDEYDAVDTDGDGVLSAAELDAAKARRLAEMSAEDGSAGEPQEGDGVAEEPKEGDQESGTAPEPQEGEADAEAPKEDNDSTSSPQEGEVGTDELKEEDDANAIAPAPQMGEGTEEPKAGDNTTTSTPRPQEGEDAAAATNDADAAGA